MMIETKYGSYDRERERDVSVLSVRSRSLCFVNGNIF